jgi:hypothetical protein
MVLADNRAGVVQTDGFTWFQNAPFSASGWQLISSNVAQMVMAP